MWTVCLENGSSAAWTNRPNKHQNRRNRFDSALNSQNTEIHLLLVLQKWINIFIFPTNWNYTKPKHTMQWMQCTKSPDDRARYVWPWQKIHLNLANRYFLTCFKSGGFRECECIVDRWCRIEYFCCQGFGHLWNFEEFFEYFSKFYIFQHFYKILVLRNYKQLFQNIIFMLQTTYF